MQFGQRLRAERKKKELSAEMFAKACGVSRSYITLIENGKRLPSVKVLPKVAEALQLKTNVVLNWYLKDVKLNVQRRLPID